MATTFRHSAGFGRRMEYWLIGRMLREGLDVYVPLGACPDSVWRAAGFGVGVGGSALRWPLRA
jgi:hypothetical protein